MKILAIETSCDETSFALIETTKKEVAVYAHNTLSQIEKHREYGGVFPTLAKREHAANAIPLLEKTLRDADIGTSATTIKDETREYVHHLLSREEGVAEKLCTLCEQKNTPAIDAIAVTHGPGLEPALWVGINIAKALSAIWGKPVIPTNHLEGHIASLTLSNEQFTHAESQQGTFPLSPIHFPAVSLIVSGGHTELNHITKWGAYETIGRTKDDAVGEAFDKGARLLDLPYPGGPEISKLAVLARDENIVANEPLKRPMIDSGDLSFSFSGIKTAVRYRVQETDELTDNMKKALAREFEEAVVDVLLSKARTALKRYAAPTLLVTGGVSANAYLRERLFDEITSADVSVAPLSLTGDNALMIALAAARRSSYAPSLVMDDPNDVSAIGNLALADTMRISKEG